MSDIYDIPGFSGHTTTINVTFEGAVNPTGAYSGATAYSVGDSVSYGSSSYVAIQDTTGNLPTDTTYWQLLAEGAGADVITSTPGSGEYKVVDIRMDADEKIVVKYNDTPES